MKKIKTIFCLAALAACVAALSSCIDIRTHLEDDPYNPDRDGGPKTAPRTFIVYMGGDNNLSSQLQNNIYQLMRGATSGSLRGGRILVYYSPVMEYGAPIVTPLLPFTTPQLLDIYVFGGKSMLRVLKSYDKQSSVSPEVLRQVLDDVFRLALSRSYCIDFSSHGTGWLPAANTTRSAGNGYEQIPSSTHTSYAWGLDGPRDHIMSMNINDMAAILPDNKFDFIMFDACLMGGVEVAYELRAKTPYIVASVAEIMGDGFPYDKLIPHIFADQPDLPGICDEYINYYKNSKGTMSIFKTSKLPALASATQQIVQQYGATLRTLPIIPSNPSRPVVQYYYTSPDSNNIPAAPTAMDMGDAMNTLFTNLGLPVPDSWLQALNDVVIYHGATDYAINTQTLFSTSSTFNYKRYSGITMHIPTLAYNSIAASAGWNDFFATRTLWGKDVFGQ